MSISLKIYRRLNNKSFLQKYSIEKTKAGPMVLDSLMYIKNNMDTTLYENAKELKHV